jgi:hypothetical protein
MRQENFAHRRLRPELHEADEYDEAQAADVKPTRAGTIVQGTSDVPAAWIRIGG